MKNESERLLPSLRLVKFVFIHIPIRYVRCIVLFFILLCASGNMTADVFRLFIPLDSLKELQLHYPRDSFSLSMIPPKDAGSDVYYSWRLDGHDSEWSTPSVNPFISYDGLKPGKYRLDVRMHDDGRMTERHLYLFVFPPFWMTIWFYVLVSILIIAVMALAFWYYMKGLRRRVAFEKLLIYQMLDKEEAHLSLGMKSTSQRMDDEVGSGEVATVVDVEAIEAEESDNQLENAEDLTINNADETFLEKALLCVRENMSNEAFGKGDFASAMMISQSLLYKKLKALTDMSVVEFIRSIRLNHAMTLLMCGDFNVTEVSELCGFSSSAYFSRVFKDSFGKNPSEIIPKRSQVSTLDHDKDIE